jgi:hypothetical protein
MEGDVGDLQACFCLIHYRPFTVIRGTKGCIVEDLAAARKHLDAGLELVGALSRDFGCLMLVVCRM